MTESIKRGRKNKHFLIKIIAIFAMVFSVTLLVQKINEIEKDAAAANMSGFRAGNIISDEAMSDYNSMSEGEIQSFLSSQNSCGMNDYGYYLQLSQNRNYWWHWANGHVVCLSEERFGDGETIGSGETAAHIIWQAAQDYHINPKALIVLLQKETGLITDPIPNNSDYRKATGYGCPDTAQCSSKYYGFKNQVRNAASMYREVLDGGWSNYPAYSTVYVQYSPTRACGGSNVYIENRATSALYRYTPYQPNGAALSSDHGTGDGCSSYGNRNFYSYYVDWFGSTQETSVKLSDIMNNNRVATEASDLNLTYQVHIRNFGWLNTSKGGEMAGSAGYSLRMEAITLKIAGEDSGIEYRTHVENVGWMNYVRDGAISGTTGQSKQIEAIQIRLTGDLAKIYDVYYRTHVQGIGWTGWSKNDEVSGTTGQSKRVEAVQVKIVKKEMTNGVQYSAHVQDIGWMGWIKNGKAAGTTGQSKRLEAIKIKLPEELANQGTISYKAHVQNIGWMDWVKNGEISGTTGKSLRVEALKIKLSGKISEKYDILYRSHVQYLGWTKWVKNDAETGTTGQSKRMEAVEIVMVEK